jgi:hypothetical protein
VKLPAPLPAFVSLFAHAEESASERMDEMHPMTIARDIVWLTLASLFHNSRSAEAAPRTKSMDASAPGD